MFQIPHTPPRCYAIFFDFHTKSVHSERMTTFTVPWERCPKEGVIEEDDYRKTCKQIISHADWYGRCGASWESDEIFGMDAASKAHLESLVKVPTLDERCHIHCYNYRTDEMDEYMHTRRLCERYYHFFKVFAVDRKAERVFISPDGPQFMITKCFGANQERADAHDFKTRPLNVIPVLHKALGRWGFWLCVNQNQEFLEDWLGFIECDPQPFFIESFE